MQRGEHRAMEVVWRVNCSKRAGAGLLLGQRVVFRAKIITLMRELGQVHRNRGS